MDCKAKDWIEHPTFGIGRVSEDRGDRLDVDFINSGAKIILKTAELKPALSPSPDFKFPRDKNKSRTSHSQMSANKQVHASFEDFINSAVIPHQAAHRTGKGWMGGTATHRRARKEIGLSSLGFATRKKSGRFMPIQRLPH
jgi:hypothetical protein